ncbi:type II secretion system F family protein [Halomonas caseinilytica]|uniref:type II secretion system F family protein n=1 Tax=Halomonas caseinilytica TaxID=438744 RepID=UPI0007E56CE4|nr:type II secretion system F family protein [Halomonas caseinilytica]SEM91048.1 type IV pilus assembly protein PilC [Halomonas caseinilytica]
MEDAKAHRGDDTRPRRWRWTGRDADGRRITGEVVAPRREDVARRLAEQRILVRHIRLKRGFGTGAGRVGSRDIMLFARQMATLLRAGIPVLQGFKVIANGVEKPAMRLLVETLGKDVAEGASLAEALERHPRHFGSLFTHLVAAGEQSGTLERMLDRVATHKEKVERLQARVRKALWYPAVVLATGIVVATLLLIKVVPRFEGLFRDFGAELPALTRLTLMLSQAVQHYWLWGVMLVIGLPLLVHVGQRRSSTFAGRLHALALRLPVLGDILAKSCVARYCRTLATTVGAGVPLVEGLESAAGATGNRAFGTAVDHIRHDVLDGQPLHVAMRHSKGFPSLAIQMIAIGEESGTLDQMLDRIADHYEQAVDERVDVLTSLLEPAVIVILGVMVGGLVVAMYLPIFALGGAI